MVGSIKVPDRSTGSPGFRGSDMIRALASGGWTIAVIGIVHVGLKVPLDRFKI